MAATTTTTTSGAKADLLPGADWERIERFLKLVGEPGVCNGADCGEALWWVRTKTGKLMPVNSDLTVHWATCPNAPDFKRASSA